MEEWKAIEGFENYEVSNLGNVRSHYSKDWKLLKPAKDAHGYFWVYLSNNSIKTMHKIHRLVAQAFIDNPQKKVCVDHIDGNPLNNHVTNLRWATRTENQFNMKIKGDNTSGHKGIYYSKGRNKWEAYINLNGKKIHLGRYKTKEEAIDVRRNASAKYQKEFQHASER